jgi:hypothetical protein
MSDNKFIKPPPYLTQTLTSEQTFSYGDKALPLVNAKVMPDSCIRYSKIDDFFRSLGSMWFLKRISTTPADENCPVSANRD